MHSHLGNLHNGFLLMRCLFNPVAESEKVPGWTKYECIRCKIVAHSPYDPEDVIGECDGCPLRHEMGEWVAVLAESIGINPELVSRLSFREERGCDACEARKAWLNSLGSRLYRLLVRRSRLAPQLHHEPQHIQPDDWNEQ